VTEEATTALSVPWTGDVRWWWVDGRAEGVTEAAAADQFNRWLSARDRHVRKQALLDAHALCTTTTDAAAISRLIEAERDLKETPHA